MFPNWQRKKREPALEARLPETDEVPEEDWEEDESEEEDEFEEEELDAILQRAYEWGRAWSETPSFAALSEEQKDEAEYITGSFTEYMYNYHGVAPEDWNVAALEACCLDTLPRKISAEDSYFRSLAPVLSSFFTFLDQTGLLPHAAKLAARVRALDKKIVKVAADPRHWGIAKSFVMAAKAAGVDLTDKDQLDRFMMQHNAEMAGQNAPLPGMFGAVLPPVQSEPVMETFERTGPKVGRNDPCPCGSGKKYKKCCGA